MLIKHKKSLPTDAPSEDFLCFRNLEDATGVTSLQQLLIIFLQQLS
mgnify:CR=1 FL=1